jgi:hypothetical protein
VWLAVKSWRLRERRCWEKSCLAMLGRQWRHPGCRCPAEDIVKASFLFRWWSLQVKTLPILGGRRRRALASCFFLKTLPLELLVSVVSVVR